MSWGYSKGQSLVELIVGIAVGIIFIVGAVGIIMVSLRIDFRNTFAQTAHELALEQAETVRAYGNADWHNLDGLATSTPLHLATSTPFFDDDAGAETIVIGGNSYTRSFTLEPVYRTTGQSIGTESDTLDPSTLRIVSTVSWTERGDEDSTSVELYLTRHRDRVFAQTDWSGGPIEEDVTTNVDTRFATSTNASTTTSIKIEDLSTNLGESTNTNIDPVDHWGWSDVGGWIDFHVTGTVTVTSTKMMGFASSSVGPIVFDCASTPAGDICATSDFKVAHDGAGNLSGFAWNDMLGWISFSCENDSSCGTSSFGVTIDENGFFHNFAWTDVMGWIAFNCEDVSLCGTSAFKVKTFWGAPVAMAEVISSIFTFDNTREIAPNTIMWQGSLNTGAVKFQIATDCLPGQGTAPNCGGHTGWSFLGPDGTSATYYQPAGPGVQMPIKRAIHNNKQYMRYKVILESDINHQFTPEVEDVILNWSL